MATVFTQICFSGESSCEKFQCNKLRPNICRDCMKLLEKHLESVCSAEDVVRALEYSSKGEVIPSCVIDCPSDLGHGNENTGRLFLGGFRCINVNTFETLRIKAVVCVAQQLQIFGPSYTGPLLSLKETGVSFLDINWIDNNQQILSEAELKAGVQFIHSFLSTGVNVLVHCAQGKSRSTSLVMAYLLALKQSSPIRNAVSAERTVEATLEFIQTKRKMAEPNSNFLSQLTAYYKQGFFASLQIH